MVAGKLALGFIKKAFTKKVGESILTDSLPVIGNSLEEVLNKPFWKKKKFWISVTAIAVAIGGAYGIPPEIIQEIGTHIGEIISLI